MTTPSRPQRPTGADRFGRDAGSDPFAQSPVPQDARFDGTSVTVTTFLDYASAQRAVDYLSDNRFPVERATIVGTDLRLVERVIGRLTTPRAALAGAATGAWLGLLIGLLFSIFTTRGWLLVILVALVGGAIWGAIFGAVAHALTGGRRDFASRSSLEAAQYALLVDAEHADAAMRLLERMPSERGRS